MAHRNASQLLDEVGELIDELEVYSRQHDIFFSALNRLERGYDAGRIGYLQYEQKKKGILKGRTRKEAKEYYRANAYALLKRIEFIISQAIVLVKDDVPISAAASPAVQKVPSARVFNIDNEIERLKGLLMTAPRPVTSPPLPREIKEASTAPKEKGEKPASRPTAKFSIAPSANSLMSAIRFLIRLPAHSFQSLKISKSGPKKASRGVLSAFRELLGLRKAREGIFLDEIMEMEKVRAEPEAPLEKSGGFSLGWFSLTGILREFSEKFRSRQEPILGEQTAIPLHVRKLKEMRRKIYEEEGLAGFESNILAQEARRVRKILEVEKPEVYQGSSIGLIANLTVRKISVSLIDSFPEFFGYLYNGLRAANVKVLSNTYVNIMILSVFFVTVLTFFTLSVFFFIINYPLYQIALRSIILSVVAGFSCATIFYAYPFMKIKDRRRKIMTNLPFGINHMAAVATSGVPPVAMFELISASGEYSEISIEVRKIVDFINIFGYDLLTAIRTVAAITPSPQFKEFLEGMVSTIETGGDLDRYLRQEADQATLAYNLERQRYNETVSTYSDIYTGLLIAAPLFFVSAMALVNLLGGTLGGIGVDIIMAVGAYAVIPLLNIAFLLFLQFTQPEV